MINIVCSLILGGVRDLLWRQLCTSGLKFQSRVFEDGSLVRGEEKEERAKRVAKEVRKLKVRGVGKLTFGALLIIPWALSISWLAT